ncbi:hypothetical protein BH11PAT4_BH11PAT4_1930 [soil metagenome]
MVTLNSSLISALKSTHKHLVPLALVIRLVTLSTSPSLAIAATLPAELTVEVVAQTAPQEISPISPLAFLDETNIARSNSGLAALHSNETLTLAAQAKITDMQERGYWDHFRPSDKKAPWDFIRESGYQYTVAGENLAKGFKTAHGITEAWLASPSHRANLLSPKYEDVGFATGYIETPEGRVLLTVQMFGTR